MVVRIRLHPGPRIQKKRGKNRHLALALASLLTPGAVMASVLACWQISSDLHLSQDFAIATGPFSHWQAWLVSAITLQFTAVRLNRYGRP